MIPWENQTLYICVLDTRNQGTPIAGAHTHKFKSVLCLKSGDSVETIIELLKDFNCGD